MSSSSPTTGRCLRIALVSAGSFPHIAPYIDFYKSQGHELIWLAYDRPIAPLAVETVDISCGASGSRLTSKWRYLLAGMRAGGILRQFKPDVVHGHYATSASIICWLAAFRPYVITAHGGDILGSLPSLVWGQLLHRTLRAAALVNPVSHQLAEVIKSLGVADRNILVAPVGIQVDKFPFQEPRRSGGPTKIVCSRGFRTVYDPLTVVTGFRRALQLGLRGELTMAAGGAIPAEVTRFVDENGLRDYIHFLGGYHRDSVGEILHNHDIYVSASRFDGASLSLLEAMACGIFPVVSRTPANLAWLTEGVTSLMFNCGDSDELAHQMIRAASDVELRCGAAHRNRELVVEHGGRMKHMLRIERAMYSVLRNAQSGRD